MFVPTKESGKLYKVDWYPGMVLGGKTRVLGDVYEVDSKHLDELDRYEGNEYKRVWARIYSDDSYCSAMVWEYRLKTDSLPLISNGDWSTQNV